MGSKVIKVEVVKNTSSTWYGVGQVCEVLYPPVMRWQESDLDNGLCYICKDNPCAWVQEQHCRVVPPTLQEQLQEAKDNVEAIEKLLVEEANKPFSREDYERVVAKYRACKGRKAFVTGIDNHCLEISEYYIGIQCWDSTSSVAPFGVWFGSSGEVEAAIKMISGDMLRKAWAYEMCIGLKE